MKLPLIIVNFKLYEQGTGRNALDLAKIHERVADETGASIAVAVNALDLENIVNNVKIPVLVQHVDDVGFGSHTGHISPHLAKEKGAVGTLLNHAECSIEDQLLRNSIDRAKDVGLRTVVCAHTPEEGEKIMDWEPDLVAVEPPELIGGDISVSKAKPEIVEKSVDLIGANRVLVGAGVKNSDDVRIALALGAVGVLLASGITKVEDPYAALVDLVEGLKAC